MTYQDAKIKLILYPIVRNLTTKPDTLIYM